MIDIEQLIETRETVLRDLLSRRTEAGHWVGRLSASALSTATAVSALALIDRHATDGPRYRGLIDRAIDWLVGQVNDDGGWGDTDRSRSNLATTMLVLAAIYLAGADDVCRDLLRRADDYARREGGVAGLRRRYGRDKTFAVPILTNCALAGLVPWTDVASLPFELACLPHGLLRFLRLPVVSYALPALVAIGQARYFHARPRNPLARFTRRLAVGPSLKKLRAMQPAGGGYLEAVPLTSFVVMSLAATGRSAHPVAADGVRFLCNSVREDGSWPIDTNLAAWNTTLAVNAMPVELLAKLENRESLRAWIVNCQHRAVHPFTRAAAGGWGWTDAPGAVPDADDTAGALLALARLESISNPRVAWPRLRGHVPMPLPSRDRKGAVERLSSRNRSLTVAARFAHVVADGVRWLLELQNADGGWPTFCRGWGALPFDRSGADLTAHALRALHAWRDVSPRKIDAAVERGLAYLARTQRDDGSWTPLWFGNEHEPNEENPIYGTARVLLAYRDLGRIETEAACRGLGRLGSRQNADGGWGGDLGRVSSVEETAVATEALLAGGADPAMQAAAEQGLAWLARAAAENRHQEPSPIGFYFARLWYYESMYPLVFAASALTRAVERFAEKDT
ncbi:MAG TPA: prenyltransferase/squalene oxidase repeat-containing protein [Thermoguttaceae bacterium]|nr:prenyltransferase/squalene oxidase repeat-containing protein [Thermoguttaceae bacterium]